MSKNSDDFFGGFFDFNGDGKTDIGEEWIGYKILEDIENNDNDDFESGCSFSKPSKISAPISTPTVQSPIENKDCSQNGTLDYGTYKKRKNSFLGELWISIIVCIAFMVIPCVIVYAAVSSYDEKSSASVFVTLLFIGLACFIAYAIIKAFSSFAKHDMDCINKLNEQFQETALPDEQAKQTVKKKRTK